MDRESKYWKCEYERLRKKKNREIALLKNEQYRFFDKTWKLLKMLGVPDIEILRYYQAKL